MDTVIEFDSGFIARMWIQWKYRDPKIGGKRCPNFRRMQHVWLQNSAVIIGTIGDKTNSKQGCTELDSLWPTLWQLNDHFPLEWVWFERE